jgi:hypothetical protein
MVSGVGLYLTILWFAVLFIGGMAAGKLKSELYKGITIGALIAIPMTFVVMWFFG